MKTRARTRVIGGSIAVLLGLLVIHNGHYLELFRDPVRLREWVRQWGVWAPFAVIALQVTQVLLAPIPGHVVGLASGYLFGVARGTFYSVLGTAVGSLIALVLTRRYGRPLVQRLLSAKTLAWLDGRAQRRGLFFFVLVFLLPFLPDDVACLVAGLTPIPIPGLMLAVLAGRPPGILVSAWIGSRAAGLDAAQWALVIAGSALLALLFLFYGQRLEDHAMDIVERLTSGT